MLIVKKALRRLLRPIRPVVPVGVSVRFEVLLWLGYWPNLERPTSFNEKIQHWKLRDAHSLATACADKWAARQYVLSKTNRPDILNELYFVGTNPLDIPFHELPRKFVIKATHGSGWTIVVRNKATADIKGIVSLCRRWLRTKYSGASNIVPETHYDAIVPRIIVEKFIEDATFGIPLDYKFFCFNGAPAYVQVDADRFGDHRRNFYDLDWREMDFRLIYDKGKPVPRPSSLNEMIDIASTLSRGVGFCRVDLYNADDGKVLFGEMTFAPESGLGRFSPREWDYRLGALWNDATPGGSVCVGNRLSA